MALFSTSSHRSSSALDLPSWTYVGRGSKHWEVECRFFQTWLGGLRAAVGSVRLWGPQLRKGGCFGGGDIYDGEMLRFVDHFNWGRSDHLLANYSHLDHRLGKQFPRGQLGFPTNKITFCWELNTWWDFGVWNFVITLLIDIEAHVFCIRDGSPKHFICVLLVCVSFEFYKPTVTTFAHTWKRLFIISCDSVSPTIAQN